MDITPDEHVRTRGERWRVTSVISGTACRAVGLRGAEPSNAGDSRVLLVPFDVLERGRSGPRRIRTWRSRGWNRRCRSLLAQHGGWAALRTASAAAMDVLPYQLEPALAVVHGGGCRVLLADAVGLGKTLQAGLLIAELFARAAVRHALLLTPAGLRDQWAGELAGRFGLAPVVFDLPRVHRLTSDLPPGANPWCTSPLAIASIDFVKRPEVAPIVRTRGWDLVVVDEAHVVSPDSDRYAALAALCANAAFVVLVTATPHNGDRRAFEALCALGAHDPLGDPLVVFRRSREHVHMMVRRRVHRMYVAPSAAEERMHATLARYAAAVGRERGADEAVARLLATVLGKRALSSPESLRRSVARRLECLDAGDAAHDAGVSGQLRLPLGGDGETDADDESPVLSGRALKDGNRERRLLTGVLDAATAAVPTDSKLRALKRLLVRLERVGESAIVFTEYRDTLLHVRERLGRDAVLLHGGMSRQERRDTVEAFTAGHCRLLLATDAGGEGLNLHARCRCVVHLELPWNPVRLEQRTGRVDRVGQRRAVHSFHLLRGRWLETAMVDRLEARMARAQQDIGAMEPAASPAHGIRRLDCAGAWKAAAEDERVRILRARRLDAPSLDPTGGAIGLRRPKRRLRATLGGRSLLLVSAAAADASGRCVARHVSGLLIEAGDGLRDRAPAASDRTDGPGIRLARALTSPSVIDALEAAGQRLLEEDQGLRGYAAFWKAAAERAEAIERGAKRETTADFQPGLFDRRAERERQLLEQERRSLVSIASRRRERYAESARQPDLIVEIPLAVSGWR